MNEDIINRLPNRPQGYAKAQKWYSQLKEKFVSEIQNNLENIQQQQEIKSQRDKVEKAIVNAKMQGSENTIQYLQNIINQYFNDLIKQDANLETAISLAKKELETSNKNNKEAERQLRQYLLHKINLTFDVNTLRKILTQSIQTVMQTSRTETQMRYSALITQTSTILQRLIAQQLNKDTMSYYSNLIMLGGYIKEDLEYQALSQLLDIGVQVRPGGTKAVEGQQTHMDIILSNIIEGFEEFERNFNKQITITREGPFLYTEQAQQDLLNNIKYFGEQSKTFSLWAKKRTTGDIQGLRISEQSDMFKIYEKSTKDPYNLFENIKFLGKYQNILRAFGADTLLFATKDGRYFMDDFIQEIKKENYYLLFGINNSTKLLSSTVVIDKPWYTRIKQNKYNKKLASWHTHKAYI